MVVSTKTAKDEQRKLTATFFNNVAVKSWPVLAVFSHFRLQRTIVPIASTTAIFASMKSDRSMRKNGDRILLRKDYWSKCDR